MPRAVMLVAAPRSRMRSPASLRTPRVLPPSAGARYLHSTPQIEFPASLGNRSPLRIHHAQFPVIQFPDPGFDLRPVAHHYPHQVFGA